MRVLIDNGSYHMDNMGDVAMLQMAVRRVRERWPRATVDVLVETPDRLRDAIPEARPVTPSAWHVLPVIPRMRRFRGPLLRDIERRLPLHAPRLSRLGKRRYTRSDPDRLAGIDAFYDAVDRADAVICSGGGFINDHHAEHAQKVLATLALAQGLGKPTAMFGAGLGPLTDTATRRLARAVLPRLDVLALREPDRSVREARELGVAEDRLLVTGDDAIELTRRHRPAEPGDGLGVNVRVAAHAAAPEAELASLGAVIADAAAERGAPLIPLPVRNRWSPQNDLDGLREMFAGQALDLRDAQRVDGPADLIRLAGRCRAVVTGAYHAAVFALAQGAAVVGLAGSAYYEAKFGGLRQQFGDALTILRYDAPDLPTRLREAIDAAWSEAPQQRTRLIGAAEAQIDASLAAYDRFFATVAPAAAPAPKRPVLGQEVPA